MGLEVTEDQFTFLKTIAELSQLASDYGCMPRMGLYSQSEWIEHYSWKNVYQLSEAAEDEDGA
jgi:hypothetical protein